MWHKMHALGHIDPGWEGFLIRFYAIQIDELQIIGGFWTF